MHPVSLILSPIIFVMRFVLETLHGLIGDYGGSIILLSVIVRLVTAPIAKLARGAEERSRARQAAMEPELAEIRAASKGRERFERIDAVYQHHKYHPIHNVSAVLPLFLQIPFLLSALFLLSEHQPLAGQRFLVIRDLLQPDRLLPLGSVAINVLPLLICAVALFESAIGDADRSGKLRFLIVTAVIVVLIYAAPAGVCLYWLTSNVLSLGRALWGRRSRAATEPR